jgi:hypothetical protein
LSQVGGYIKEMNGENKVHYHKWCGQVKNWRETHSVEWKNVMSDLLGHFQSIQLEEQKRLDAEHAARLEQVRRREEEERMRAEETARLQPEEAKRQAKALKKQKKGGSFAQKLGQKIKAVKESLNCRNNKAIN